MGNQLMLFQMHMCYTLVKNGGRASPQRVPHPCAIFALHAAHAATPPRPAAACSHTQSGIREMHLASNQLTGPAFPPAWLAPSSTLDLSFLSLEGNQGLVGTLPASLNWSRLAVL